MRGTNTIHINQATMLEAINLWLASEYKSPPEAKTVKANSQGSSQGFDITIESPVPETQK